MPCYIDILSIYLFDLNINRQLFSYFLFCTQPNLSAIGSALIHVYNKYSRSYFVVKAYIVIRSKWKIPHQNHVRQNLFYAWYGFHRTVIGNNPSPHCKHSYFHSRDIALVVFGFGLKSVSRTVSLKLITWYWDRHLKFNFQLKACE